MDAGDYCAWRVENAKERKRERDGEKGGYREWRKRWRQRLRSNVGVSVHADVESVSALALTSRRVAPRNHRLCIEGESHPSLRETSICASRQPATTTTTTATRVSSVCARDFRYPRCLCGVCMRQRNGTSRYVTGYSEINEGESRASDFSRWLSRSMPGQVSKCARFAGWRRRSEHSFPHVAHIDLPITIDDRFWMFIR